MKQEKWEELRDKFIEELRQALKNNIPYAQNTNFPSFLDAVEKGMDMIVAEAVVDDRKRLSEWIDDNVGASSRAIFLYMTKGSMPRAFDAPSDDGDRARCVVLLRACPEWVDRLKEIESLNLKGTSNGKEVFPWNEQIPIILSLINGL